jgi:transposase
MPTSVPGADPDCASCRSLGERLAQAQALIEELLKRNGDLERRLAALEQASHRQAAPFRRPEHKRKPESEKGKSGRRPGHEASYRPPPERIDDTARVPLARCPHCQGPVTDVRPVVQIIQDLVPVRVRSLQLTTHRGHCAHCGEVRSTHPAQVSTATGAAGVHLGPQALALSASLNKHHGLTMRRVWAIFAEHFGLRLSPGGLSQALDRIADQLAAPYAQLQQALRQSPAVHADETGWWVGGRSRWLWAFTCPLGTFYQIDNRSQEVIRRVLGDDYQGVLISDCLASYDPHPGLKSKCVAHHLKAISEALGEVMESEFLTAIKHLFKAAIVLHSLREDLPPERYAPAVAHLEQELDRHLAAPYALAPELRIANRLRKQRPHLLTFLHLPGVAPTNNLAERQLRPAVIARKLSCGNKTPRGQRTFEVLASLAATCRQQGRSFSEMVSDALRLAGPSPPPRQCDPA